MKNTSFQLEFTTHVLANGIGPEGKKDHFQRDSLNNLIWQQSWWYSAFTQAIELARVRGIKAADIHMNLAVKAPTELYRRHYGDDKFRVHEAIMPGSKVTFEAVVADHVTGSSLSSILDKMGKYVGLSPYGFRLGFGKFLVVDCVIANSDAENNENSETIGSRQPTS